LRSVIGRRPITTSAGPTGHISVPIEVLPADPACLIVR
jgi:hypothetical protein